MHQCLSRMFVALSILASVGNAFALESIVLAVPGPGSLVYLPVQLAQAIGADRAEGLDLKLRYFPGGPMAMRDLDNRNSDFAVVGMPAIASARADGMAVLAIGQLSQVAMVSLMLRSDLRDRVKTIAQLKGMRIGMNSSTRTARSTSQMLTEYLLARAGILSTDVQFVPTGQSREAQRAAFQSKTVDAMMGDEPFASEMTRSGHAILLADLYAPRTSASLLGGPFVHAALSTREDVFTNHPETVRSVHRMLDRTLQWLAKHGPSEILEALAKQPGYDPHSINSTLPVLERNPGMYTLRLAWDEQAVAVTERFFLSMASDASEKQLHFSDFVRTAPQP